MGGVIFTSKLFKEGFSMPNLLQNDATVDLINRLEVSEKNLSSNMANKDLVKSFLATADSVQQEMKKRYNDLWISPSERQMMGQTSTPTSAAPEASAVQTQGIDEIVDA